MSNCRFLLVLMLIVALPSALYAIGMEGFVDEVFLNTEKPLPVGTRVDLNLLLNQGVLSSEAEGDEINIITSGEVIRTNGLGMAIEFDELHKIIPTKL